ncbi:MAG: dephospho-CoA kinase [Maribacter sp.]|jgi:dephospho-CoA kinase
MKVGITGGIGSGKTTVCRIFELLGIPVYYADDRAKWLMKHDPKLIEGIQSLLGTSAYFDDGELNRPYMASIIFNDKAKLEQMNTMVHPAVWMDGEKWNQEHKAAPYTLKEAALLYETGGYQLMDQMITIFANKKVRLKRVMSRDNATRQEVFARMDKQMPNLEKARRADFVIKNDGKHLIIRQVLEVHQKLLILAAK